MEASTAGSPRPHPLTISTKRMILLATARIAVMVVGWRTITAG